MRLFRLLVLATLLAWAGRAAALDLPQNRPNPDRAALEQMLQRETAMPPGKVQGFTHLPDTKAGTLIQPDGREFRDVRTRVQPWVDAALIVVAVGSMAVLFFAAGPMRFRPDPAGRTIKRFTAFERFIHWLTAASFVWLSLTGLNLVFGRYLLQPLIGDNPFAFVSAWLKLSHNSVGFAFIAGLAVMIVQWFTRNLPSRVDIAWFKALGGMFGGPHPPTQKFNAGQKMIYWIAASGGGLISLTGVLLLMPFYVFDIGGMQITHGVHSVVAALMIAVVIGHIYLGSVGVQGSFRAMSTGRVDLNWAKTHHGLWVEEEMRKGAVPSDTLTSMHPAE